MRRSEIEAPASTELTTPANRTANPTRAVTTTASQVVSETSVPTQMRPAPAAASATCETTRSRIGPLKSTSRSSANEPKAANVAIAGLWMTSSPSAKTAGMTIAPRPARRSAARAGSRARTHAIAALRTPFIRVPLSGGRAPSAGARACRPGAPRASLPSSGPPLSV